MTSGKTFTTALLALSLLLVACGGPVAPSVVSPQPTLTSRDLQIVSGQMVYVPAYSEIFLNAAPQTMRLTVTLAIHNTDPDATIYVQSARYYDTDGELVRDYVTAPVMVPPLATTGFIVEDRDTSGGWGANFIVEWGAEEPVYEPIIEALMVSTQGTHGISMISPGRVVSQTTSETVTGKPDSP